MQPFPNALEARAPALYSTEDDEDPQVICRFMAPAVGGSWFVLEGEDTEEGDCLFFGLVVGQFTDLGCFRLSELVDAWAAIVTKTGNAALPGVLLDECFAPMPLSCVKALYDRPA